jgi:LAS superfamily LD-carboxypeptidase LdcB
VNFFPNKTNKKTKTPDAINDSQLKRKKEKNTRRPLAQQQQQRPNQFTINNIQQLMRIFPVSALCV